MSIRGESGWESSSLGSNRASYSSLRELVNAERHLTFNPRPRDGLTDFPQSRYSPTKVVSSLFLKPGERLWIEDPSVEVEQKDYVLYIGCNILQTPFLLLNCVNVLRKVIGTNFAVVGGTNLCCGSPLLAQGRVEAAESFDRKRMNFFSKFKPKIVIEWDESCNEFTHANTLRYLRPDYEMVNIERFLADNLSLCPFQSIEPRRVTIHDHYGHKARYRTGPVADYASPRKVLSAIPGIEILEMEHNKEDALECGYDLITNDRMEKMKANDGVLREARQSGAATLLVMWQACCRAFTRSEVTHGVRTRHFIDLVAEALGLSEGYEDKYKQYRLSMNLDWVLLESKENIEANGYTMDEIRPYVERYLFTEL